MCSELGGERGWGSTEGRESHPNTPNSAWGGQMQMARHGIKVLWQFARHSVILFLQSVTFDRILCGVRWKGVHGGNRGV